MSQSFLPNYGVATDLAPRVRRIVAPNPSPMTYAGTNTYLIGTKDIAIIDPGPMHDDHMQAIQRAIAPSQKITQIIVTHSHLDHTALARPLAEETGAPVLAFGAATSGRSAVMRDLFGTGPDATGEGVDHAFDPDEEIVDGQIIQGFDWQLEVLHTPGHLGNHICLALDDLCFTADHVMAWSSSLISPPDGDLTDFMASCRQLRERPWRRFFPGHGSTIEDPLGRLDWLIEHRQARESAILLALEARPSDISEITASVYTDIPAKMREAAERNVLAHLVDLCGKSRVRSVGSFSTDAVFEIVSR